MKLEQALRECTLALLRKMAVHHGVVAGEETLRSELASLLLRRLLEPGHLEGYLPTLSEEELGLLGALRDQGWRAKAFVLERLFPQRGAGRASAGPSEPGPTLSLLQKGLLFRTFGPIGSWRGELFHLPDELQPVLAAALPASTDREGLDLRSEAEPDLVTERRVQYDLFCLLSFFQREPRRLVRGAVSRVELAKLEEEAGIPSSLDTMAGRWEERWRFLLHLALAGGWIRRDGGALKPTRGAGRALAGGAEAIRTRLLELYLRDRSWSDLAMAGKVRQVLGARQIDEVAARRLLLHHLETISVDGWIDEERFFEGMRRLNPDFLREDYASLAWAVVEVASGAELYGSSSWDLVEGEWLRYVLRGPLQWLGIVRCGLSRGGKAVGFQVTGGVGRKGAEESGGGDLARVNLVVGGDRQLESPENADLALLYRLEPYLDLAKRGPVSRYRLTRASVIGGLERGGSEDELREMLIEATAGSAPDSLLQEVSQWTADYGRFRIEGGVLLTAATAEDAELLAGLPGMQGCLEARLGARSYRVAPERVWQLVQGLRKAGHLPRVEPSARLEEVRRAGAELSLLRESLFALKLLRTLHEGTELENGAEAVKRLETALGPEEVAEVSRKVQSALRQMQK